MRKKRPLTRLCNFWRGDFCKMLAYRSLWFPEPGLHKPALETTGVCRPTGCEKHPRKVAKLSLTLLEVILAITLLTALLAGVFNLFRQGVQKNVSARELKQQVLQWELFQQKMRTLLATSSEGAWIDKHPDSALPALFIVYQHAADPDVAMRGEVMGMLYLNRAKELCLSSWSAQGATRVETLLENIDTWTCQLFDAKQGAWNVAWPQAKKEPPAMVNITLTQNANATAFAFFLRSSDEKILYKGQP